MFRTQKQFSYFVDQLRQLEIQLSR